MISPETWRLIKGEELIDVEWKESIPGDLTEIAVSFANAKGGVIIIGVKDERDDHGMQKGVLANKGKGVRLDENSEQRIRNYLEECVDKIDYEVTKEEEKPGYGIFLVGIKEGINKPYCTPGGTYKIRIGNRKSPILPNQMKALIEGQKKAALGLYFYTPEGPAKKRDIIVYWLVDDEEEKRELRRKHPHKCREKKIEKRISEITFIPSFLGGDDRRPQYLTDPKIEFVLVNEGDTKINDIHISLRFPADFEIAEYSNLAKSLTGSYAINPVIKGNVAYFEYNSLQKTLQIKLEYFSIEYPKEDGSYEIKYQIVSDEKEAEGELTLEISNYYELITEVIINPLKKN